MQSRAFLIGRAGFFLPAGFPDSVANDYLPYQLWAVPCHITGWMTSSLATSSLLQARPRRRRRLGGGGSMRTPQRAVLCGLATSSLLQARPRAPLAAGGGSARSPLRGALYWSRQWRQHFGITSACSASCTK